MSNLNTVNALKSAIDNLNNFANYFLGAIDEMQWNLIGFERNPDGTENRSKPYYSFKNPNELILNMKQQFTLSFNPCISYLTSELTGLSPNINSLMIKGNLPSLNTNLPKIETNFNLPSSSSAMDTSRLFNSIYNNDNFNMYPIPQDMSNPPITRTNSWEQPNKLLKRNDGSMSALFQAVKEQPSLGPTNSFPSINGTTNLERQSTFDVLANSVYDTPSLSRQNSLGLPGYDWFLADYPNSQQSQPQSKQFNPNSLNSTDMKANNYFNSNKMLDSKSDSDSPILQN